jgi:hypothetical protein
MTTFTFCWNGVYLSATRVARQVRIGAVFGVRMGPLLTCLLGLAAHRTCRRGTARWQPSIGDQRLTFNVSGSFSLLSCNALLSSAAAADAVPWCPAGRARRRSDSGRGCAHSSATTTRSSPSPSRSSTFRCDRRGLIPLLLRPLPPPVRIGPTRQPPRSVQTANWKGGALRIL